MRTLAATAIPTSRLLRSACCLLSALLPAVAATDPTPAQVAFFEKKVRPVLVNRCYTCHSADTKPAGGLRVDDRNGLITGGDSGPAVIPGDPEKSLLLQRILHTNAKLRMPKEGDLLTSEEAADVTTWIRDGAAWPVEKIPVTNRSGPSYDRLRARHWAFQALTRPAVPNPANTSWPATDVDRFLLAKLEQNKLAPVPDADPATLIRRVTFDLTGLPPTPAELTAFLTDKSAGAYTRLVDRLLASPRFGERWGRHWLDVARYGESTGPSRNIPYPHAWRYRDYVLDAVNNDIPFDRFIQEQVAGDLLPASTNQERDRLLIATGFLAIGPKDVNQRFKGRFLMDNVDEQIDTVSRSVLALTVSCARCHDHKFDPIPVTDYYAMAGIFTSTDNCAGVRSKMGGAGLEYYDPKMLVRLASDPPPPPADKVAKLEAAVAAAKKAWNDIRDTPEGLMLAADGKPKQRPFRLEYERLQAELLDLTDPAAQGFSVHGLREGKVADTAVRIRGEAERIGPTVPRGVPTAFQVPGAPAIDPKQSGRLQLAQWLTNPANPLTPRVIVNRVWKNLFGQGIVGTMDNFGITGDRPTHPELLDHLASSFVQDGWSVKRLVRSLVLSRAYRLGSQVPAGYREIDPANRLLWRHSPRRLEAEEIRDAMLSSADRLRLDPPKGSSAQALKMIEMPDNGPEARSIVQAADGSVHRSIYLPLLRGVIPKSLEAFDPVSQTLVTGQRDATTVPAQALYLLNSQFVRQQSLALANRLLASARETDASRIRQAYLLVLGRAPSPREILRAERFLSGYLITLRSTPVSGGPLAKAIPVKPMGGPSSSGQPSAIRIDTNDAERVAAIRGEGAVHPENSKAASWMSLIQALYASAEFQYIR